MLLSSGIYCLLELQPPSRYALLALHDCSQSPTGEKPSSTKPQLARDVNRPNKHAFWGYLAALLAKKKEKKSNSTTMARP